MKMKTWNIRPDPIPTYGMSRFNLVESNVLFISLKPTINVIAKYDCHVEIYSFRICVDNSEICSG